MKIIIRKFNLQKFNFLKQFQNNIFSNIIYISGADFKSCKIEDIRNLKKKFYNLLFLIKIDLLYLMILNFLINNSLNALLKIIEEPSKKNYFFLINNKSKPLLETIKSRALEIKIILNESQRLEL